MYDEGMRLEAEYLWLKAFSRWCCDSSRPRHNMSHKNHRTTSFLPSQYFFFNLFFAFLSTLLYTDAAGRGFSAGR